MNVFLTGSVVWGLFECEGGAFGRSFNFAKLAREEREHCRPLPIPGHGLLTLFYGAHGPPPHVWLDPHHTSQETGGKAGGIMARRRGVCWRLPGLSDLLWHRAVTTVSIYACLDQRTSSSTSVIFSKDANFENQAGGVECAFVKLSTDFFVNNTSASVTVE